MFFDGCTTIYLPRTKHIPKLKHREGNKQNHELSQEMWDIPYLEFSNQQHSSKNKKKKIKHISQCNDKTICVFSFAPIRTSHN